MRFALTAAETDFLGRLPFVREAVGTAFWTTLLGRLTVLERGRRTGNGPSPRLTKSFGTSVPGLFLAGDLTAGKKGGRLSSRSIARPQRCARSVRTMASVA